MFKQVANSPHLILELIALLPGFASTGNAQEGARQAVRDLFLHGASPVVVERLGSIKWAAPGVDNAITQIWSDAQGLNVEALVVLCSIPGFASIALSRGGALSAACASIVSGRFDGDAQSVFEDEKPAVDRALLRVAYVLACLPNDRAFAGAVRYLHEEGDVSVRLSVVQACSLRIWNATLWTLLERLVTDESESVSSRAMALIARRIALYGAVPADVGLCNQIAIALKAGQESRVSGLALAYQLAPAITDVVAKAVLDVLSSPGSDPRLLVGASAVLERCRHIPDAAGIIEQCWVRVAPAWKRSLAQALGAQSDGPGISRLLREVFVGASGDSCQWALILGYCGKRWAEADPRLWQRSVATSADAALCVAAYGPSDLVRKFLSEGGEVSGLRNVLCMVDKDAVLGLDEGSVHGVLEESVNFDSCGRDAMVMVLRRSWKLAPALVRASVIAFCADAADGADEERRAWAWQLERSVRGWAQSVTVPK